MPKHFDEKFSTLVGNSKKQKAQSILRKQYDFRNVKTDKMKKEEIKKKIKVPHTETT